MLWSKTRSWLTLSLVAAMLLAACGTKPTTSGGDGPAADTASGGPIALKIGAVGSKSGGGTAWGVATERGVQLAIDEVMAQGGLKVGDKTYKPTMLMYDDQYTGQGGTTAATRLVNEDKVKYIIGPIGSPAVLGVINVTNPAKVLVLDDGFSPKILTPDSKYNYRVSLSTFEFGPPIAKWLRTKYPNAKTVGMIYPNDEIGQTIVPMLAEAYKENGFTVVYQEPYERGKVKDFAPLLTKMLSQEIDIFDLNSNAPGEAGLLVKQARQLGYKGTIIQTGGPGIDEVIKVAGDLAEGFLSYDIFDPSDPAVERFVKAYNAKYNNEPINAYAPIMYNATQLLFEALKKAGDVNDVDKVKAALEGLEGQPSLLGTVKWVGDTAPYPYQIKHQLLTSFYISEVENGTFKPIEKINP